MNIGELLSLPRYIHFSCLMKLKAFNKVLCRYVMIIAATQLYSTESELRFSASSDTTRGVLEVEDGENLQ